MLRVSHRSSTFMRRTHRNTPKPTSNFLQRTNYSSMLSGDAFGRGYQQPGGNSSVLGGNQARSLPNIVSAPTLPYTLGVCIVPHAEKWVVQRFGKFSRTLGPGINFTIPFVDHIKYRLSTKEVAFEIPDQMAITKDNVIIRIDGVLYIQVRDAFKASYEIDSPVFAIMNLAQTTMRSEIGKISLDKTFEERDTLNDSIVKAIKPTAEGWGLEIKRYEIRDITVPDSVRQAMDLQAEAERRKRKKILESEGEKMSDMNIAEGRRTAIQLLSEAARVEQENHAKGEAEAINQKSAATAEALVKLANALTNPKGLEAVSLRVAEQYIAAFENLAKKSNTMIVPSNANDSSSMIAQALSIFKNINHHNADTSNNAEQAIPKQEALRKLAEEVGVDTSQVSDEELTKALEGRVGQELEKVNPKNVAHEDAEVVDQKEKN
eukprot:gb/GECH01012714.1/.p1 GENE.gb/GECH01012714.1/~~gb/GECH01012714.1/.p1  ORF type:complete len:434 (+),score=104.87 gb/GECH01012714.1/:1-1302(+)